jgi:hypothetical protein
MEGFKGKKLNFSEIPRGMTWSVLLQFWQNEEKQEKLSLVGWSITMQISQLCILRSTETYEGKSCLLVDPTEGTVQPILVDEQTSEVNEAVEKLGYALIFMKEVSGHKNSFRVLSGELEFEELLVDQP